MYHLFPSYEEVDLHQVDALRLSLQTSRYSAQTSLTTYSDLLIIIWLPAPGRSRLETITGACSAKVVTLN